MVNRFSKLNSPPNVFTRFISLFINIPGDSTLLSAAKLLSELQVWSLIVYFILDFLTQTGDISAVYSRTITQTVSIDLDAFTDASKDIELLGATSIYLCLLILLTIFLMNSNSNTQTKHQTLRSIFCVWIFLHHSVIFLPIHRFSLFLLFDRDKEKPHPAAMCISIANLITNCFFAVLGTKCGFSPLKKGKSIQLRNSNVQFLGFVIKCIEPCFHLVSDQTILKWIRILSLIFLTALRLWYLNCRIPVLNLPYLKIFSAIASCELVTCITGLILLLLESTDTVYIYFLWISFPIAAQIANLYMNRKMDRAILDKEYVEPEDFFMKLISYEYVLQQGNQTEHQQIYNNSCRNNLVLCYSSIIKEHITKCNSSECTCYIFTGDGQLVVLDKAAHAKHMNGIYFEIVKKLFLEGIEKVRDNSEIKICFADFMFRAYPAEFTTPILLLLSVENGSSSMLSRIISGKLIQEIEDTIIDRYRNEEHYVNARRFYDYDSIKRKFQLGLKENIDRYVKFWEDYSSSNVPMKDLFTSAEKINKASAEINKLWNYMGKAQDFDFSDCIDYLLYMSLIGNAPFTARRIMKRCFKKKIESSMHHEIITPQNFNQNRDAVLYISLTTKKIIHTKFTGEFLGYNELIDQDFEILVPPFLRQRYQGYFQDPHSLDQKDFFHKTFPSFGLTRLGLLRPVTCYLAPLPYMRKDLVILAIIRPVLTDEQYLIVNGKGEVTGYSEDFGRALELDIIPGQVIQFRDICVDYEQIMDKLEKFENTRSTVRYVSKINVDELKASNARTQLGISEYEETQKEIYQSRLTLNTNHKEETELEFFVKEDRKNRKRGRTITFAAQLCEKEKADVYTIKLRAIKKVRVSTILDDHDENISEGIDNMLVEEFSQNITNSPERRQTALQTLKSKGESYGKSLQNTTKQQVLDDSFLISDNDFSMIESQSFDNDAIQMKQIIREKMKLVRINKQNHQQGFLKSPRNGANNRDKFLTKRAKMSSKSSIASSTQEEARDKRLEAILNSEREYLPLKLIFYAVVIHLLLSVSLFFSYLAFSNSNINKLPKLIKLIEDQKNRIYFIYDAYWDAWLWANVPDHIFEGFGMSGTEYYEWLMTFYRDDATLISQYNQAVQIGIRILDEKYQANLYKPIRIIDTYDNDKVYYANGFIGTNDLAIACGRAWNEYVGRGYILPTANDLNADFIRKNSLNDVLIANELVFDYAGMEAENIFNRIGDYIIVIISVILTLSLAIYGVTCYLEFTYIREKDRFTETFLRLQDDQVDEILEVARRLRSIVLGKSSEGSTRKLTFIERSCKEKEMGDRLRNFKKKEISLRGLNTKAYLYLFFLLLFQCVTGAVCLGIIHINEMGKQKTYKHAERIIETNKILFTFSFTFISLYEYITTDGTSTARNNPISEEWMKGYTKLTESFDFFFSLREEDENIRSQLDYLLNGNLCETLFINGDCTFQVPQRGLLAINSFLLNTMKTIKDTYDNSNHTSEAKTEVFNLKSMRDIEEVYFYNGLICYEQIQKIITDNIYTAIDFLKSSTLIVIIVFSIAFAAFTGLIWYPIWRNFLNERWAFNRILRVIPVNIILRNGYIKTYLITHSGALQISLKNIV